MATDKIINYLKWLGARGLAYPTSPKPPEENLEPIPPLHYSSTGTSVTAAYDEPSPTGRDISESTTNKLDTESIKILNVK